MSQTYPPLPDQPANVRIAIVMPDSWYRAQHLVMTQMNATERDAFYDAYAALMQFMYLPCPLIGAQLDWYAKRVMKFRSYVLVQLPLELAALERPDIYEPTEGYEAGKGGPVMVRETSVHHLDMQYLYQLARRNQPPFGGELP